MCTAYPHHCGILPYDRSQEGGKTPTMKVKRNVVAEKYADRVAAVYGESATLWSRPDSAE